MGKDRFSKGGEEGGGSESRNTDFPQEGRIDICPEGRPPRRRVWHGVVSIVSNERIAHQTLRLQFVCPPIAQQIVPGQFVMVRLPGAVDPLFGRALALYDLLWDSTGLPVGIQVVYRVVGRVTGSLACLKPNDRLEVWGPLGNGFPAEPVGHLVMVAGGIGFTPFLALGREALGRARYGTPARPVPWAEKVSLCYGEPTASLLAPLEEFHQAGIEVHLSTEDGSHGHQGLVTEWIEPLVAQSPLPCQIVCCGPEPMMAATAKIAHRLGVPCLASLERPMACGLGICFSCVVPVRDKKGGWDYRRVCLDGPVFDAHQILWTTEPPEKEKSS